MVEGIEQEPTFEQLSARMATVNPDLKARLREEILQRGKAFVVPYIMMRDLSLLEDPLNINGAIQEQQAVDSILPRKTAPSILGVKIAFHGLIMRLMQMELESLEQAERVMLGE